MKNFANPREPWADELWNVSLLPLTVSPELRGENALTLGRLENIDERRSIRAFVTHLSVSHDRSSGRLV